MFAKSKKRLFFVLIYISHVFHVVLVLEVGGVEMTSVIYKCDRLQENWAQRGTLRKKIFFELTELSRPDIELSKFYHRSLSRSHYNRPNRSLPSA